MSLRNLSPIEMFFRTALEHRPTNAFTGKDSGDFARWKEATLPKVLATLGESPAPVPANPQKLAEWRDDGLRKEKWLIDVQKHLSATLYVNYPGDLRPDEKRPALFCCHGHGPYGKEPVMGNAGGSAVRQVIRENNYDYGHQMAKAGFVTYAIDFIGFGERGDGNKPNYRKQGDGRDWCNIYYLHATMLGMTSISINVAHGKAATTVVTGLPEVDGSRLGVMGLSGGGTMTLWMTLCDERFKASEIICYSDLWAHFGIHDVNYCGMQVSPGLYRLVDLPDAQGLIAPRPLLIDLGANDTCFQIDTAMRCFEKVEAIYRAAGAREKLELDLFPGGHSWGGNKSVEFFRKHLSRTGGV